MATTKRKMPVKTAKLDLNGDWQGWSVTTRINPPLWVLEEIASGDISRIATALGGLITDWNFVDENGDDLPKPSEDEIRKLPTDLVRVAVDAITDKITATPPN